MNLNRRSEKFWDFSLALYGNEEVALLCLDLQDRFAVDINMLLFCCWQALRDKQVDSALLKLAVDFSNQWQRQLIQPLRESRRWMKSAEPVNPSLLEQHSQLRKQIKRSELAAERIQQEQLQYLTEIHANAPDEKAESVEVVHLVAINIRNYLQIANIELDNANKERLLKALNKYL